MEFIDHFRLARRLFRALLSGFDLNVRFGGLSHAVAEAGPAVIVMPGSELIAHLVLTAYYPRPFHAAVGSGIWNKPILRGIASRLEHLEFPPPRYGWLKWIRNAVKLLQAGGRIALFVPPDFASAGKPCAGLAVAAMLCRITGCAFVPIASDGCDRALPAGCLLPRVVPIRMLIGKPVRPGVETAISHRNHDWARMFQTDLSILQQRLLACPSGIPEEAVPIEPTATTASGG